MTRETSGYLDLVRFMAALTVCLGHLSGERLTGGFLWQLGPFMSAAVDIFFVLSGFVIGHVTQRREHSLQDYAVARAARVYSVALPALIITFVLDNAGQAVNPALYQHSWGYIADDPAWQFLAAGLFLNQLWLINIPPGSMLPYWSLSFEVWYYIIFGLALFMPMRWRFLAVTVAITIAGPRILGMFPLWLLGLLCSRLLPRLPRQAAVGWILTIGSFAGCFAYLAVATRFGRLSGYVPVTLGRPELLEDYLVAVLFAANLVGFSIVSPAFAPLLRPVARPIQWLAGATFTLYLLHLPIAQFLTTLMPWPPQAPAARIVLLCTTLVTVFLVAEVTERRKATWRNAIVTLGRQIEAVL